MSHPCITDDATNNGNILISGASGLIGTALKQALADAGYRVYSLRRDTTNAPFHYRQKSADMYLDPEIPLSAVINLAGANIADKRWSGKRKQDILESRRLTTRLLCEALAELPCKPGVLLSASAIGYYGDTGEKIADETSPAGKDFLAQVAVAWEQATAAAESTGIRTVHLRFGLVLSNQGGVLKNLILPLRLAVVGAIGDGKQYMSWISLEDVVSIIRRAIQDPSISGPINLVSNEPVSNSEFSRRLARALQRLRLPPLPAFLVRLMFGEMGDAALLSSARIRSVKLQQYGIELAHPELDAALQSLL